MKVLAILFLVLGLGFIGFFFYKLSKTKKAHIEGEEFYKIEKKEGLNLLYISICGGLSLSAASILMVVVKEFAFNFLIGLALVFGPLIFTMSLCLGLGSFILCYYKVDLDKKQSEFLHKIWPLFIVTLLIGLWIFTEGIAHNSSIYPLVNGISFSDGFVRPGEKSTIAFYGVLIVCGALICYGITDHMVYQKYKKHGLIDTLFIVAFLLGILGARLWYCIVLEPEYYFHTPGVPKLYFLYGIVDGGLAIQGGALLGIASGVAFVLIFRKYMDVRFVMDVAIPTILIAQVMGRWGNFFNQEVYGAITSAKSLWFVPTIVRENMCIDGQYRVPLFFIEGCINLGGYFFIRYFLGKVCKFHVGLGYQASAYLIWYGAVRVALEKLRDSDFEYNNSWIVGFVMMGIGVLLLAGFYLLHYLRAKRGLEDEFGNKIKQEA